jgi:hypothetical protein
MIYLPVTIVNEFNQKNPIEIKAQRINRKHIPSFMIASEFITIDEPYGEFMPAPLGGKDAFLSF